MKTSKAIHVLVTVLVSVGLVLCAGCTGSQGERGTGIESIADNGDGTFTINFTDGSTFTTSDLTGPSMPVIQSLGVSDLPARPGGSVTGTVVGQSAGGLGLTYDWAVSGGWTIESGGDSATVCITAPDVYGASGTATVNVTDSNNMTATGTISLCTERNIAPVVHTIWCSRNPVVKGGTIDVSASVSDPNGDTVTYDWRVPGGWAIQSGQGTSQISVLAPNRLLAGGEAELTVSDGGGGSVTASLYVGTLDGAWGTAELIETDSGDAGSPQVAVDAAGNAVAVWGQWDGTRYNIWANRYEAGIGWGSAELIETDSGSAYNAQVAVDGLGNAIAVWQQDDGTRYNIWANRYEVGVGWGSAELIETDNSGDAGPPQVAVDAAGNAVAVWGQWDGTRYNIRANRYEVGVGWGSAVLIETDSGGASNAQVAVDGAGNAVAVWHQWDGTRWNIWANRYEVGTGWGSAVLIETDDSADAYHPQVAVDAGGNAVAVWDQGHSIWANQYEAGTGWGSAVLIETDSGSAEYPSVAVDAAGNAVAVWSQSYGTEYNIWANRYKAGTGWGSAVLIETDDSQDAEESPQVAVDGAGNAVAVWRQPDGTGVGIWANRYVAGEGWGSAVLIETDNSGSVGLPQVAVDGSGNAIAVWYQSDGTRYNILANRFR